MSYDQLMTLLRISDTVAIDPFEVAALEASTPADSSVGTGESGVTLYLKNGTAFFLPGTTLGRAAGKLDRARANASASVVETLFDSNDVQP